MSYMLHMLHCWDRFQRYPCLLADLGFVAAGVLYRLCLGFSHLTAWLLGSQLRMYRVVPHRSSSPADYFLSPGIASWHTMVTELLCCTLVDSLSRCSPTFRGTFRRASRRWLLNCRQWRRRRWHSRGHLRSSCTVNLDLRAHKISKIGRIIRAAH